MGFYTKNKNYFIGEEKSILFKISFFGHEACEILVFGPGTEPTPPALEDSLKPLDHHEAIFTTVKGQN